jgi:cytosine deaminase
MTALANAGRQPPEFYRETVLYTTLSPCPMCTGAMILYGIPKVVIGTPTVREWGEDRLRELGVEVVHTRSEACAELLSRMITQQRELIREDGGNFCASRGVTAMYNAAKLGSEAVHRRCNRWKCASH